MKILNKIMLSFLVVLIVFCCWCYNEDKVVDLLCNTHEGCDYYSCRLYLDSWIDFENDLIEKHKRCEYKERMLDNELFDKSEDSS